MRYMLHGRDERECHVQLAGAARGQFLAAKYEQVVGWSVHPMDNTIDAGDGSKLSGFADGWHDLRLVLPRRRKMLA